MCNSYQGNATQSRRLVLQNLIRCFHAETLSNSWQRDKTLDDWRSSVPWQFNFNGNRTQSASWLIFNWLILPANTSWLRRPAGRPDDKIAAHMTRWLDGYINWLVGQQFSQLLGITHEAKITNTRLNWRTANSKLRRTIYLTLLNLLFEILPLCCQLYSSNCRPVLRDPRRPRTALPKIIKV